MQDILLKVFVVALGLLTYPTDDPRVEEEWDGEDVLKYEFRLQKEETKLEQEMAPVREEITHFDDKGPLDDGRNIHMSGQHVTERDKATVLESVAVTKHNLEEDGTIHELPENLQLDMKSKQREDIQTVSSKTKWREDEFLEGFVSDLLETMRTICNTSGGMVIEDFNMVDAFDINVPFTTTEPYSFQCLLWNNQVSDLLPDMQVCGQVKVVETKKIQNCCPCQSSDADDDMVCLLHCENDKAQTKITNVCHDLCLKNTPLLSKSRVTRWFQSTIKQAWALISHKYEFELIIRYIDAPGALAIRFRSGKMIRFKVNPVVKFNTGAHFYITPCSPRDLDTFWTLSLASYEDNLLQCLSEHLPDNACHIQTLEIARFLHRRNTPLLGSSVIKDFHFKTALMHLLLTKDPSQWKPKYMSHRLQDLMDFMERSLERKLLHHVLIGNPLTQKFIQLPAAFTQAKPVNLFHPLVVHNCIYRNAVLLFQEMLRNAHMLIQDYVEDPVYKNGGTHTEFLCSL
uniref:Inositol 1,4,5-trisphosphate receptor-interacting protein n=1 Tax=Anabas testudineus TaxID=64144 RepID=A0A3Q1JIC9_ANATE